MILDSWLIARLARDLNGLLRGARVQDISSSPSGIVLYCYRRGASLVLQAALGGNTPLVAVDSTDAKVTLRSREGWAAGVAALLRGCVIDAVQPVPNDRVLLVDLSSRSAFGLSSPTRIVLELQPQKANALVLRPGELGAWVVVAAAKQFRPESSRSRATSRAQPQRLVKVGAHYVPPPPRSPMIDRAQFLIMADRIETSDVNGFARLLTQLDPTCTPPLSREVGYRVRSQISSSSFSSAGRLAVAEWDSIHSAVVTAEKKSEDIFVYRKGSGIIAAHLIPLRWPEIAAAGMPSVNALSLELIASQDRAQTHSSLEPLRKRLLTMQLRARAERDSLENARKEALAAETLREAGDAIYAALPSIPSRSTQFTTAEGVSVRLDPNLTPKENAAAYFRRYKKARSGLPRIEERLAALRTNDEYWDQLLWELDRTRNLAPAEAEVVFREIREASSVKRQREAAPRFKRTEKKVTLGDDAVAYVGRSPKDNERLTFSVAGPNDFWFHARSIPGAHVIVKSAKGTLNKEQIEQAASLAASNSRAADAAYVEVDYTQRKHVRRQRAGRPGMVWYTDFKTIRVKTKRNV